MNATSAIRALLDHSGMPVALDEKAASLLLGAMLDGGLDELELGAAFALLQVRPPTVAELIGYSNALSERCTRVEALACGAPVVLPAYRGAKTGPNLLPLLAFALQRLGVPVLVHGVLDSSDGVAAAYIFRELGVMPCGNPAQAREQLEREKLAFVPSGVLAPGLSGLFALRARLGFGELSHVVVRLLDPVAGDALRVVPAQDERERAVFREFLQLRGDRSLLLLGADGGAVANVHKRPALELLIAGNSELLFDAEHGAPRNLPARPLPDARTTALWIRDALRGQATVPQPILNQLAACLYGSGHTEDLVQAKAIVALETCGMIAA